MTEHTVVVVTYYTTKALSKWALIARIFCCILHIHNIATKDCVREKWQCFFLKPYNILYIQINIKNKPVIQGRWLLQTHRQWNTPPFRTGYNQTCYILLYMWMAFWQDGQRCSTSLQESTQKGIQQQRKHPNMASPPQMSQVMSPAVCSVWVITVCWQWGHTACPGRSCSSGDTTTWVTVVGIGTVTGPPWYPTCGGGCIPGCPAG